MADDAGMAPHPLPEPVISVRSLVKRYGDLTAVDGIDLEIRRGEIFALLGPNGAGKTTTVEILEGYRTATSGEVRVLGEDPARAGVDWRARVGIVLQSSGAFDQLTVAEVLHHFAGYYPDPNDPDAVIEQVGLGDKRDGADDQALGRAAPAPRRGAGHHRPTRAGLPRRADDRVRPRGPAPVLGPHRRPPRGRAPPSCSPPTTSTRPRPSPIASG